MIDAGRKRRPSGPSPRPLGQDHADYPAGRLAFREQSNGLVRALPGALSREVLRVFPTIRSFHAPRRAAASLLVGGFLLAAASFPATAAAVTPTCDGVGATIVGQPGQATIRGTQGPDVIVALEPGVRVDGRGGDDIICTDAGDNIINGGSGNDSLFGGAGDDTIDGGAGDDVIWGGDGNDILLGDSGNDSVDAGDGNDLVSLGSGDDWTDAGPGDDRIDGGKDSDSCFGGGGTDSIQRCEN